MDKNWKLDNLPLKIDVETKKMLKKLASAHSALAELKGTALSIPNQNILINSLGLQEAKDSSAIENIVTTHDELFKNELALKSNLSQQAKEVQNYIAALKTGFALISEKKMLTNNMIIAIQEQIEKNKAGYRKLPGTDLKNAVTGKIIYTPPQNFESINNYMKNLEAFINVNDLTDLDPIVKMAIIHYQFESIHPFYDGNGRTGRIINILYLILNNLLHFPILYLSSYIIKYKTDYYRLLQEVRTKNNWEDWILYMISCVEETSRETIYAINEIKNLMLKTKHTLRENYKFYSQDLLNNLFKHPYTKIDFIIRDLGVSRITASNYLNTLANDGILKKEKLGKANYFINIAFFEILSRR